MFHHKIHGPLEKHDDANAIIIIVLTRPYCSILITHTIRTIKQTQKRNNIKAREEMRVKKKNIK